MKKAGHTIAFNRASIKPPNPAEFCTKYTAAPMNVKNAKPIGPPL